MFSIVGGAQYHGVFWYTIGDILSTVGVIIVKGSYLQCYGEYLDCTAGDVSIIGDTMIHVWRYHQYCRDVQYPIFS